MWAGRVRGARLQTAPEVDDGDLAGDLGTLDELVFQSRIAVDRPMKRRVKGNDGLESFHEMAKAVDERRVCLEELTQAVHVVLVPDALKRFGKVFWISHDALERARSVWC